MVMTVAVGALCVCVCARARARVCLHSYAPAADIYVWKGKTPATLTAKVCADFFTIFITAAKTMIIIIYYCCY